MQQRKVKPRPPMNVPRLHLVDENSFVKGLGQQLIPNLGASLPRTALKIQQNGRQNPQNFEIIADKNQQGIHWHVRTLAFDWADLSSVINW